MNTLHWPDEIRSTEDLDVPEDVKVSPAELKMAENLVGIATAASPRRNHESLSEGRP